MANLTDSIRLNTEVDLNGLINLIQEFKDLNIKVKDVAAASRALTEQIKRDNIQQVNSVKLSILEHDKLTAALINEDKVDEQASKSATARSKKKTAELTTERIERKNSQEDLLQFEVIQQGLNATEISNSNKKAAAENAETAAINKKRTAIKGLNEELLADSVVQRGINATEISESNKKAAAERAVTAEKQKNISITKEGTAVINQGTAAINQGTAATKQDTAELQRKRQTVQLNTDEEKLYNAQLRNRALETASAKQASDKFSSSLISLSQVGSNFLAIFGIDTLGSFSKRIIDAQSSVQAFGLSMKNLIGNAYGEKLVNDLKQFTVETPLNFEEVIKSTNQLVGSFKAAGISSKTIGTEIPQILESIGNSAAALGGDDRMGRLVYAFSQVQATGRLMGTEVRQITETGFPMLAVLTQSLNERFPKLALSVSDVQKRVSDGKVSFDDFKIALLSAGQAGGVFAGGMEARMATVAGSLDKLQESVFFALANIGNQFNDTAKQAIDFGMSIVKSLFGTESAAQRTVEVVSNLTKIYLGYRAAIALVATGTAIKNAYDSASLVLQGLLMRAKAGLNLQTQRDITLNAEATIARLTNSAATGVAITSTDALALAQARAAIATRSLTTAFGVIAIVLGVAYAAYEIYKSTVAETDEKQKELNDRMALGIAPIIESQSEFNRLAGALKKSSDATQEKTTKLEALKAKFPDQLKGINDLATAEKLLGDKANDTNIMKDYRLKLFNQLKTKFPEQTKGLKDVKDSETDLSIIMKEVNGDFILRQQLMKDEIAMNMNREKINIFLKERVVLENKLKTLSKEERVIFGEDGTSQVYKSEAADAIEAIKARDRWVLNLQETNAKIAENSIKTTEKLKFNWETQNKDANNAGKEQSEKALKYKTDTDKQKAILDQTNALREQQQTRENQQKILDLEKEYGELKVANAKGSQTAKVKELQNIENKYLKDSANLTREWDKKEAEERLKLEGISLKEINDIRSKFRALSSKDDKDSLKEQLKAIESKYELEIEYILKSNNSSALKRVDLMRTIILEEKEISTVKSKIDQLKVAENLRGQAAKQIKKDTDDINEKSEFKNKLNLEQINHEKSLSEVQAKRNQGMLNLIGSISGETKEFLKLNEAINESKIANQDLIKKKENLLDIISKGQLLTKEGAKAQKEADDAAIKSAESTTEVQLLAYNTLLSVAQKVFDGIKKSIVENMLVVSKSYEESNKIFQEFVVKKREADLKAYQQDLDYRLKLSKNNLDKQLDILDEYFTKAKDLIKERDLADAYAVEFESLVNIANEKAETNAKIVEGYSMNTIEIIKNLVSNTLTFIGKANDGLTKSQEVAYKKVVASANSIIQKLEWQRDNTIDLLDRTIEVYKEKYEAQTKIVKDETDKQIDAVNKGLSANLDKLGSFYDAQGNIIRTKYGDILDNNVRYTDTAFEEQLAIWNSARDAQEGILKQGRDSNIAILKSQYEAGTITLDEYLSKSNTINSDYQTAVLAVRTKFYDSLQAKTNAYNAKEAADLKDKFDRGLISETEYNTQLGVLDDIKKQRSKDIKSIVTKDRDEELAYLKTFYYDAKVFEEQKAANAIVKINQDAATKLQGIAASSNAIILGLENKKRETMLAYNSQIFEENRRLALAQAELAQAESKAAAWKNPLTVRRTIADIEAAFSVILSQIANAANPFAGQLLEINIRNNQTPVITDGNIQFEKGTDDTSVSLRGQRVVDNKGGWQAILHPQEAVFSKADMTQMETVFGKRPTRQEVIENFKIGVVNQVTPQMNPFVIQKVQANGIGNFDKLSGEIRSLAKEVSKKMSPVVYVDKGGIRTYYKNLNSQIEVKNQRFK